MIIEPTGWGVECGWCDAEQRDGQRLVTWLSAWVDAIKREGWIVLGPLAWCSLDCLLRYRGHGARRKIIADFTTWHMAGHATACCALHRTHATRGRHSWDGQCVDPNRAGVAVL